MTPEETKEIICPNPNCGYKGKPEIRRRGNVLVGVLLLLFSIIPGLLYFIFYKKTYYICSKCGIVVGERI